MSWLFSRALVEASSAAISSAGEPSAPSSSTPTPQAFLWRDKTTVAWRRFPSGMMCEPLTDDRGAAVLMSFLAASPARTSAPRARARASKVSDPASGKRWSASWVKYDRNTSSWRTVQCSLVEGLDEFSEIWPRWGMMRDGACSALSMPALLISASASGSWPTLNKMDAHDAWSMQDPEHWEKRRAAKEAEGIRLQFPLRMAVQKWPTPTASDATSGPGKASTAQGGDNLRTAVGGLLNPDWTEWLMGWPIGWTALQPLEMDRFREWSASHGRR